MILAQFQSLYPTGSLISELVEIYNGKYIVRASVQIDGVTRATGMAAAETPEEAEDQARVRALGVLGITNTSEKSVANNSQASVAISPRGFDSESTYDAVLNSVPQTETTIPPQTTFVSSDSKTHTYSQDLDHSFAVTSQPEPPLDTTVESLGIKSGYETENQPLTEMGSSNVTPFPQRSYNTPKEDGETQPATTKKKKKSEPVDQSDDIAKIGVEMQRLSWTIEQGKEHLIKTYGKRSRHLLDPEELCDFLKYLESQPTPKDSFAPIDPIAGF